MFLIVCAAYICGYRYCVTYSKSIYNSDNAKRSLQVSRVCLMKFVETLNMIFLCYVTHTVEACQFLSEGLQEAFVTQRFKTELYMYLYVNSCKCYDILVQSTDISVSKLISSILQLSCEVIREINNIFNNFSWRDNICKFAFFGQVKVIHLICAKCIKLRRYEKSYLSFLTSNFLSVYIPLILTSINSSPVLVKCDNEEFTQI